MDIKLNKEYNFFILIEKVIKNEIKLSNEDLFLILYFSYIDFKEFRSYLHNTNIDDIKIYSFFKLIPTMEFIFSKIFVLKEYVDKDRYDLIYNYLNNLIFGEENIQQSIIFLKENINKDIDKLINVIPVCGLDYLKIILYNNKDNFIINELLYNLSAMDIVEFYNKYRILNILYIPHINYLGLKSYSGIELHNFLYSKNHKTILKTLFSSNTISLKNNNKTININDTDYPINLVETMLEIDINDLLFNLNIENKLFYENK